MAKAQTNPKYVGNAPPLASADEALLGEFYSLLATIARRLTTNGLAADNDTKNSKSEGARPC